MITKEMSINLALSFPKMYINDSLEAIIYPPQNYYFLLDNCFTEEDVKAKVLEFLSRGALKGIGHQCHKYLSSGINNYLGTTFSNSDFHRIYIRLGNRVNHELTIKFIQSGYDMNLLEPLPLWPNGSSK